MVWQLLVIFLAAWGLLRCRIIAAEADAAMSPWHDSKTEYCTLAELAARTEAERTQID